MSKPPPSPLFAIHVYGGSDISVAMDIIYNFFLKSGHYLTYINITFFLQNWGSCCLLKGVGNWSEYASFKRFKIGQYLYIHVQ